VNGNAKVNAVRSAFQGVLLMIVLLSGLIARRTWNLHRLRNRNPCFFEAPVPDRSVMDGKYRSKVSDEVAEVPHI
jgi:hypothetical protein